MKLETIQRDVASSGLLSVHRATIQNSAKMFEAFSTKVYSDQIGAIVRELVSNAIDGHTQAGNDDPVDLYLPDDFDPYLRIKDKGIGMSHAFVTGPFMTLGDGSTKDSSDDVIGGHGIGSKSPLGYTDQMTLTSIHNGTKTTYTVFKDHEGIPTVATLEQVSTNEANGVEFSIPVESHDFQKFRNAAQNQLRYFIPRVRVHGTTVDEPHFLQRGDTWAVRPGRDKDPQVIMGGVCYPIDYYSVSSDLRYDDRLGPLLQMPLDLFMPIGSCSVPLSREALLYDDKTKQAIRDHLSAIIDEITADIPTMFDDQPSKWAACKALHEYLGGDEHSPRSRLVLAHARYQGEPLKTSLNPDHAGYQYIWDIQERGRGRRMSSTCPSPKWEQTIHAIQPFSYHTVLIDDLPQNSKSATIKRIRTYVDDLDSKAKVLVIRPWEITQVQRVAKAFGGITDYMLTSALPEPERVKVAPGTKLIRPKVRMFSLSNHACSSKNQNVNPTSYSSPLREIAYADQPDEGVLLVMDSFTLPAKFWQHHFLFQDTPLYLVNKSDAEKLKKSKFTPYEQARDQLLLDQLLKYPTAPQWKALKLSCLDNMIHFIEANPTMFDTVSKQKPLGKLKQLIDTYRVDVPSALYNLVVPQLPAKLDPDYLLTNITNGHWKFMALKELKPYNVEPSSNIFKIFKELI